MFEKFEKSLKSVLKTQGLWKCLKTSLKIENA